MLTVRHDLFMRWAPCGRYGSGHQEKKSRRILKIVVDELKMANIYHRRFKCKNREALNLAFYKNEDVTHGCRVNGYDNKYSVCSVLYTREIGEHVLGYCRSKIENDQKKKNVQMSTRKVKENCLESVA